MLSNTWDSNLICRLLGYTMYILVIIMVRERLYKCGSIYYITTAKDISGYTMYYKEVIKLELFIFLESLKVL